MEEDEDKKASKAAKKKEKEKAKAPAAKAPARKRAATKEVEKDKDAKNTTKQTATAAAKAKSGAKRKIEPQPIASPEKCPKLPKLMGGESGESSSGDAAKEKRRVKAQAAWAKLEAAKIDGLMMPKELGERISFTLKDPEEKGSSIGVILSSESFYISKAVSPEYWPTSCSHIKVNLGMWVSLT